MAADEIVRRHSSFGPWQKKFNAEIAEGRIGGEKVLVIKPQTFMNNSGQAVGEALALLQARAGCADRPL
jgi:PTH1 family peptidyl-tRNA hydrolase